MHPFFRPASRSHLHLAKIRAHVMHINIILKPVSLHFVAHLKVWKLMSLYLLQIFRQNSGMVTNFSVTIDWERNKSFYSDCVRKSKERSQLNHLDCGDDTIRKLTRPFALSTLPQFLCQKHCLHYYIYTIVTVGQKERRNEVFLRYGAKEHIVKKLGRKIFRSWSW